MKSIFILLFLLSARAVELECLTQCVEKCNTPPSPIANEPPPLPPPSSKLPPPSSKLPPPSSKPPPPSSKLPPPSSKLPPLTSDSLLKDNKMTKLFPLGSCRMGGPSLPYELLLLSANQGSLCFTIKLSEEYNQQCIDRNLEGPCINMISNCNKIVLAYRHVDECGYDLTLSRKHLEAFPWNVKVGGKLVRAARYQIFSPDSTKPHAAGDVSLFKWEYGKNQSSVEVDINRTNPFKRAIDNDMNNYKLCIVYEPNVINLMYCIVDKYAMKYSFYDPYKSICTVGTLSLI